MGGFNSVYMCDLCEIRDAQRCEITAVTVEIKIESKVLKAIHTRIPFKTIPRIITTEIRTTTRSRLHNVICVTFYRQYLRIVYNCDRHPPRDATICAIAKQT